MPLDWPHGPKLPRNRPSIFLWPATGYFAIAVLLGAIVAALVRKWTFGQF